MKKRENDYAKQGCTVLDFNQQELSLMQDALLAHKEYLSQQSLQVERLKERFSASERLYLKLSLASELSGQRPCPQHLIDQSRENILKQGFTE
jgi:hypothetical protein